MSGLAKIRLWISEKLCAWNVSAWVLVVLWPVVSFPAGYKTRVWGHAPADWQVRYFEIVSGAHIGTEYNSSMSCYTPVVVVVDCNIVYLCVCLFTSRYTTRCRRAKAKTVTLPWTWHKRRQRMRTLKATVKTTLAMPDQYQYQHDYHSIIIKHYVIMFYYCMVWIIIQHKLCISVSHSDINLAYYVTLLRVFILEMDVAWRNKELPLYTFLSTQYTTMEGM